jgi:hypothetical protein
LLGLSGGSLMYTRCYASGHLKCDPSSYCPVICLLVLVYHFLYGPPGLLNMLVGSLAWKGHLCWMYCYVDFVTGNYTSTQML